MVASSSGSAIDRLNLREGAEAPFSESVSEGAQSDQDTEPFEFPLSPLPDSPRGSDTGLVVHLFTTPPRIFGIPQAHQVERDHARHGNSGETLEESGLDPLEAEALSLSRMLKSLQPLDSFPGFPSPGLPVEPDSPGSIYESQTRRSFELPPTFGGEVGGFVDEQTGLRRGLRLSVKDKNESFISGGFANIQSPAPKSPKSKRRTYSLGYSSRGSTPSSSIGSASELQFPPVDLRSPPSPEPLGIQRPGSPLKWRSRTSSVSPIEDGHVVDRSRDTPVQGLLVARNPSFSEYISNSIGGKHPFEDLRKKLDVNVEPEPSAVVRKLRDTFVDIGDDEIMSTLISDRALPLDPNDIDYSFALEYQGPPIDHLVPKVDPMTVSSGRSFMQSPQSPIPTSPANNVRGSSSHRRISVSLTNPFPAWFNSDRERSRREGSSPSSFSERIIDPGSIALPTSPRFRSSSFAPEGYRERGKASIDPRTSPSVPELDRAEMPAVLTSSPVAGSYASTSSAVAGPRALSRASAGASDEESDLDSTPELPSRASISRSFRSYSSDNNILGKSDSRGLWRLQSATDYSVEDPTHSAGHRPRSMSLPGIQAIATLGSQAVGSHLTPTNADDVNVRNVQQRKKGECHLCHKGGIFTEKESCLVCNSKYCYRCVLTAMESMPEGRKCKTCIGKPVDEAKRQGMGKPSRLLNKLLSSQEVQQIMKAEKECSANQLSPEQLFVNDRQLTPEELALLLKCPNPPQKLKPGKYWYDTQSGLWGKEGEKPDKLISPGLKVGGILREDASNGTTKVYMNNRELGKLELKMLKLAGVHCPPPTHLWVESDGSYREEGQNNSKGNIWNKASIRLLYPFFSLPTPGASFRLGRDVQRDSPDVYLADFGVQHKVHKILVLGHEGSGRSTLFKQTKILFNGGFTHGERLQMKSAILGNIYRYISILLEGRERFEEEEEEYLANNEAGFAGEDYSGETFRPSIYQLDVRLKQRADWFLEMKAEGSFETHSSASSNEYPPLVGELWRDPAIKATHKRKEELGLLPDTADYFLDKVVEISSPTYEPSDEDILRAEGLAQGSGLAEAEFYLDEKSPSCPDHDVASSGRYQLIKVGGKGIAEGCKWLDMFEDIHAILFCVALDEYDHVFTDSDGVTQSKLRQTELFDSVLKHPCLGEKPMVLLLNKYDLFEEKIRQGIPLTACEWFSDFRPVGASQMTAQMRAQQGYTYVVHRYKELFTASGHKIFTFKLNALEQGQVLEAFLYLREILKWNDGWDLFPEEAYSTDLSSYSQNNCGMPGGDGFYADRKGRSLEL